MGCDIPMRENSMSQDMGTTKEAVYKVLRFPVWGSRQEKGSELLKMNHIMMASITG